MIARLVELELAGFRAYRDPQLIPLDADIVLIHGPNGAGKTSLLCGLEFAITGAVAHLSAFRDDYPRCLRHIAEEKAHSTLKFRASDGTVQESMQGFSRREEMVIGSNPFSSQDRRFFQERCYLSQSRLSRLLELSQASSSESPEQPLVRYVRELLGLNLLETLTAGLHEAGDIRRLESGVPELRRLKEQQQSEEQRQSTLHHELELTRKEWENALAAFQSTAATGDPAPKEAWTLEGLETRRVLLADGSLSATVLTEQAIALQRLEVRLAKAVEMLGAENVAGDIAPLRERREALDREQEQLRTQLTPLAIRVEETFRALGGTVRESDNPSAVIAACESGLQDIAALLETQAVADEYAAATLTTSQEYVATLRNERDALPAPTLDELDGGERWMVFLTEATHHLHGDDCPVCGRDFSQVCQGPLAARIAAELERAGTGVQALKEQVERRRAAEVKCASAERELAALEAQSEHKAEHRLRRSEQRARVAAVLQEISSAQSARQRWSMLQAESNSLAPMEAAATAQQQQQVEATLIIQNIASEASLPKETLAVNPRDLAAKATDVLTAAREALEVQQRNAIQLHSTLQAACDTGARLRKLQRECDETAARLRAGMETIERIHQQKDAAHHLAKCAHRATTKLLDHVFNDRLNRLWSDLFRRLARQETFLPRLATPQFKHGRIRTTIEGWLDNQTDPFSQIAAVASSGNLNTAALSLFLALHLSEQPRHRLLVLDDPVQSMDDVHVVQLASLLRELAIRADRQLVLAVHERALFDYLALELRPSRQGASLLTLELSRDGRGANTSVRSTRYPWKPDTLPFKITSVERR